MHDPRGDDDTVNTCRKRANRQETHKAVDGGTIALGPDLNRSVGGVAHPPAAPEVASAPGCRNPVSDTLDPAANDDIDRSYRVGRRHTAVIGGRTADTGP